MRSAGSTPLILGCVDRVVREAYPRVVSAFSAAGLPTPRGVAMINFSPANIRKSGSGFDLPMAIALAGANGLFAAERALQLSAHGEVSLEGSVLPVRGAVSVALAAREDRRHTILMSREDARHAAAVPGIRALGIASLAEGVAWLRGDLELRPPTPAPDAVPAAALDVSDIRGHATPKAALQIAAAGRHNLLFAGPPGSGKSALLRRLPGLLPPASAADALAILKIHSAAGQRRLPAQTRPFRAPHHSSSAASLLGGGSDPRPGEVTLAHLGVLFLDELAEFRREALEGLRQPLEDCVVTIGRARRTVTMPADFLLVAAMNPCPCGYLGHPVRPCVCTTAMRRRYTSRVSGPLMDRFDLLVEVPALDPAELLRPPHPADATTLLQRRVQRAADRQNARSGITGVTANGRLADRALEFATGRAAKILTTLEDVLRTYRLSGRARVRLLRVARTCADLAGRDAVLPEDVLAAARFRSLERTWNRASV